MLPPLFGIETHTQVNATEVETASIKAHFHVIIPPPPHTPASKFLYP